MTDLCLIPVLSSRAVFNCTCTLFFFLFPEQAKTLSLEVSFTMLVCLACPLFIDSMREKINTSRVAISNTSKISEVQIQSSTLMYREGLSALSFEGRGRMYIRFCIKNQQLKKKSFLSGSSLWKEILLAHEDVLRKSQTLSCKGKERNAKCLTDVYFPGERHS